MYLLRLLKMLLSLSATVDHYDGDSVVFRTQ